MFASKKRARDDGDDLLELEHESKLQRSCNLPFRTSPTIKHVRTISQSPRKKPAPLFAQTITPAESSEEESSPPFERQPRPEPSSQFGMTTTLQIQQNFIMDMDMMDCQPLASPRQWGMRALMPSPKASPRTVTPPSPAFKDPFKNPQNSVFGGRLPTPIYGHFQQSIDTKMEMDEDPESIIPRSQREIDYENYVRSRRLPTPISEDEAMDEATTTTGGMMGRLAMDTDDFNSQKPSLKAPHGSFASPRGRLSFSMGIRADCELCRNRVPGHSNHILRT
ncbi:hypothetical protein ABVK25_010349 [Lepraria finkii]|uniref:Uncharacterized protein n=1 Tax=Lepraria finkii TaxID=1340010 RepID=A0ABR4AXE9_9LECA